MSETCKFCNGEMKNCGAPIWEYYCPNDECTQLYQKEFFSKFQKKSVVPDTPGLVRYDLACDFDGNYAAHIVKVESGDYVLYSQATAIIAENERLKEVLHKAHASFENDRTGKFKDIQDEINKAILEKEQK